MSPRHSRRSEPQRRWVASTLYTSDTDLRVPGVGQADFRVDFKKLKEITERLRAVARKDKTTIIKTRKGLKIYDDPEGRKAREAAILKHWGLLSKLPTTDYEPMLSSLPVSRKKIYRDFVLAVRSLYKYNSDGRGRPRGPHRPTAEQRKVAEKEYKRLLKDMPASSHAERCAGVSKLPELSITGKTLQTVLRKLNPTSKKRRR